MAKLRHLLTPLTIKNLNLKNRVVMPPMCQYTAEDGLPNDWHFVHYASRALGGIGLIIVEMTSILPNGRISPDCLGLWNDEQKEQFKRIVDIVHANGSKVAIQIGHAGCKALNEKHVVSASAVTYDGEPENNSSDEKWQYQTATALSQAEIKDYIYAFQQSVKRAVEAGFDAIELHAAHGYLIHQFYSPKFNHRTDEYGQDKALFGEQIIKAAKEVMPKDMPLLVRISAQEYGKDGFDLNYGCEIAQRFAKAGADVIDVSGGGDGHLDPKHTPVFNAGYQVYLANAVKKATNLPVIAVGMLDDAMLADFVIGDNQTDLVAIGRALLRDPCWLLSVQFNLPVADQSPLKFIPRPYRRGFNL